MGTVLQMGLSGDQGSVVVAKHVKITKSQTAKAVNKVVSTRESPIRITSGQRRAIVEGDKPPKSS